MRLTLNFKDESISDVYMADNFYKRFKGFMFQKKPKYNAIIIKPCNSIHTFFMHFPIDVLFLNEDMKVVKKIENLPPRKIIGQVKHASIVVEGWGNIFKNCEIGDIIEISYLGVPR